MDGDRTFITTGSTGVADIYLVSLTKTRLFRYL